MARIYSTRWTAVAEHLAANPDLVLPDEPIVSLQACQAHWQRDSAATFKSRSATVQTAISELFTGAYERYALGWKSALVDMVLS